MDKVSRLRYNEADYCDPPGFRIEEVPMRRFLGLALLLGMAAAAVGQNPAAG
jgi:hypothetical protein